MTATDGWRPLPNPAARWPTASRSVSIRNNAASRTLPLGTTARVTNLDNGRSALVVIKDRGPYTSGRIVDVSPSTAEQLDMVEDGVVPVAVEPIALPPNSSQAREGNDVAAAPQPR